MATAPPPAPPLLEITLEPGPTAAAPAAPPRSSAVPYRVLPGAPAWDAPSNQGFFACLTRAWRFLNQTLELAAQHLVLIVPSVLGLVGGLLLGIIFFVVMGPGRPHTTSPEAAAERNLLFYLIGGSVAFAGCLLTYWCAGMTACLVSAVLHGRRPVLAEAWASNCRNGMAMVWLAFITMLVNALSHRRRHSYNLLVGIGGELAEGAWRAASYLLVPVIVLEDLSLTQAMSRAVQLHRRNVVSILVGEVAVTWLTSGLTSLLVVGAAVGGYFAYQVAPAALPLLLVAWASILFVAVAGASYVRTAYYTCLYEWAVAWEAAGEPVPAPAPLAAVLNAA